jgi:response regulator NasT
VRILLAEDETIIRLDLRDVIERAGFEVCAEAKDGEEAVELARREEPDLAILDVKMPRLDGIEAARRILDERPIPIVMLTAYSQEELVSRAVEAGVFGYLVKPFREADLLPAIRAASARHEELAALRDEAQSLAEALVTRKVVERAKGLLMERDRDVRDERLTGSAQLGVNNCTPARGLPRQRAVRYAARAIRSSFAARTSPRRCPCRGRRCTGRRRRLRRRAGRRPPGRAACRSPPGP